MKRILIILLAVIIVAAGVFGINSLVNGAKYISTDNARVSAPLIPVCSMAGCQVIGVNVAIGDRVTQQQPVAMVGTPRFSDSDSHQGFKPALGPGTAVEAPVSGYVAAVWTYPGAMLGAGSQIVTLFDDSDIWVTANIDENDIKYIRPGQEAEVTVDCLDSTVLRGTVEGISPATAASFSLLSSAGNTDANFTKVAQVVPVKITLEDTAGLYLIPGSSVEVRIKTG